MDGKKKQIWNMHRLVCFALIFPIFAFIFHLLILMQFRFVALCADIWRWRDGKWYMIELVQRLQFHFHLSADFEIKIRPYGHMHTVVESFPHQ